MPRCGSETRIIPTDKDLKLTVEDGSGGSATEITLTDPWLFEIINGEWHDDDSAGNLFNVGTVIPVPAMTLVAPRDSQTTLSTLYVPKKTAAGADVTADDRARAQKMFGASAVQTYTNSVTVPQDGVWHGYFCFFGLNQPGAVMGDSTPNAVKGGWAVTIPDGSNSGGSTNGQVNLYPYSFAIIGALFGGLFGTGRDIYFLNGVDLTSPQSQQIRSDFGSPTDQGNAQIVVTKMNTATDKDWKVEVTP